MDLFLPELPKVLYVSETPINEARFLSWLNDVCQVQVLCPGRSLSSRLQSQETDVQLILVDADAPQAHDICRHFRQSPKTQHLQVIVLGSKAIDEYEETLRQNGAADYIAEPIQSESFVARIKNHLTNQFHAEIGRAIRGHLEKEVARCTEEISATQDIVIQTLITLAETRDNSTGYHIQRTQHYVRALGRHLSSHPRFAKFLTLSNIELLFKSAPLHDIGKVGIPDHILLKPGRLDASEFETMKTHPTLGMQVLEKAEDRLGKKINFLTIAKEIAYCHHEKWDGSGYPRGLNGDAIPVSARLMALADVYDAIVSRRVYKGEIPHNQAIDIIIEGRGSHFDPDVVDAFVEIEDEFRHIALRFGDNEKRPYLSTANPTSNETKVEIGQLRSSSDLLLSSLQKRTKELADDVVPFVVAMLTCTTVIAKPISELIIGDLARKAPVQLGPVHYALARMLKNENASSSDLGEMKQENLALIHACRSSKAANEALRFIYEVPTLLPL